MGTARFSNASLCGVALFQRKSKSAAAFASQGAKEGFRWFDVPADIYHCVNAKFGTFHSGRWLRKSPRWVHIHSPLTRLCSTPACWPLATPLHLNDLTDYLVAAAITESRGVSAAKAQQSLQPGCQQGWGCCSQQPAPVGCSIPLSLPKPSFASWVVVGGSGQQ